MREWRESLSLEERAAISAKQSISFTKYLKENGHPGLGLKRTPEQIQTLIKARADNPVDYTPEIRQKMSLSHIGIIDSEETKQIKSERAQLSWDNKNAIRYATGEIKCNAPGCDIQGEHHYIILNDIRYCRTHGQRLRRTGFLELQPRTSHNKGGTSAKRTKFNEQQIAMILLDNRPLERIAKDFSVTAKVIKRVKLQKK